MCARRARRMRKCDAGGGSFQSAARAIPVPRRSFFRMGKRGVVAARSPLSPLHGRGVLYGPAGSAGHALHRGCRPNLLIQQDMPLSLGGTSCRMAPGKTPAAFL